MKNTVIAYDLFGEILPGFPLKCTQFGITINSPALFIYPEKDGAYSKVILAPTIIAKTEFNPDDALQNELYGFTSHHKQKYHVMLYNRVNLEWTATDFVQHHHWVMFISGDTQYNVTGTVVSEMIK